MMADDVLTLTDDNFEQEVLKSDIPVIVDFWAPWCGPCRMVGPIVEEIARENSGKVKVGKLNVDDNQQTAIKYQVMSIPTITMFKNGDVAKQLVGARSKTDLEQAFGLST